MQYEPTVEYIPFNINQGNLPSLLTEFELSEISTSYKRSDWVHLESTVPILVKPLFELATHCGIPIRLIKPAISTLLLRVSQLKRPYWYWSDMEWSELLNSRPRFSKPYLAALVYYLKGYQVLKQIDKIKQPAIYASAIFGARIFKYEHIRLTKTLHSLGYIAGHLENFLSPVLGTLMLENGDPRLDTFTEDLLMRNQTQRPRAIACQIAKVSHGLAALGIISKPLRMRGYVPWKEKSTDNIDPIWVKWCQRWRDTSTLRPKTRESNYSFILRTGLWLARYKSEIKSPLDWDISTCADFIAAVNCMTVGECALVSSANRTPPRQGEPIAPNSKRGFLHALRRFFIDFELWGWGKLRFSPRHHLTTPRSISFNAGVNPRVIDDAVWLKLIWSSLNFKKEDLLSTIHYPLEMLKAIAVIWTHTGLRQNEILRLSLGCIHSQEHDIVQDDGSIIKAGTLCYLDVPPSKTFKAFVKPVSAIVKEYIDKWLLIRPENQAALLDGRTGNKVQYLFQFRGKKVGMTVINNTIIPILCAKAGVPRYDSKGSITSHRGRASVVTALASVPNGMSLIELMQWSGHSSPSSTMHYIRIRPTKLAASFVKADQMSHVISVIIDHDIATKKNNDPYIFYDLGNSYCTNPFWSTCPHRMACIGCDFNLPKDSARAQAVESKNSIRRYLEEVPLTPDEKNIVEGDLDKLQSFIQKLDSIPALDGNTSSTIKSKT